MPPWLFAHAQFGKNTSWPVTVISWCLPARYQFNILLCSFSFQHAGPHRQVYYRKSNKQATPNLSAETEQYNYLRSTCAYNVAAALNEAPTAKIISSVVNLCSGVFIVFTVFMHWHAAQLYTQLAYLFSAVTSIRLPPNTSSWVAVYTYTYIHNNFYEIRTVHE